MQNWKTEQHQQNIDHIVVLLTQIMSTRELSTFERADLQSAIDQLQGLSRLLPTLGDRGSIAKCLIQTVYRVATLFHRFH